MSNKKTQSNAVSQQTEETTKPQDTKAEKQDPQVNTTDPKDTNNKEESRASKSEVKTIEPDQSSEQEKASETSSTKTSVPEVQPAVSILDTEIITPEERKVLVHSGEQATRFFMSNQNEVERSIIYSLASHFMAIKQGHNVETRSLGKLNWFRILLKIINSKDANIFNAGFSFALLQIKAEKNGLFSTNKALLDIKGMGDTELETYAKLINMLTLVADPATRANGLRQVDVVGSLHSPLITQSERVIRFIKGA